MTLTQKPIPRAIKYDPMWVKTLPLIDDSYSLMRDLLKCVNDKYSFVEVLANKKGYESALNKTTRKGKSYLELGDLVKGLILTNTLQQTIVVSNYLTARYDVVKWEAKKGTLDNPYCGVIHIDVRLGNLICEIQVMPKDTAEVKKKSNHYYKNNIPNEVKDLWSNVENFSESQRMLMGI